MIYFIGCAEANAVKIGTASRGPYPHAGADVTAFARLGSMQTGCPLDLELLAICEGGRAEEAALHLRFADLRIRGEWFRLTGELQEHIGQFRKPTRRPRGWHSRGQSRAQAA